MLLVLLIGIPTGAFGQLEEEASLAQLIEAYEGSEKELADLEKRLKESRTTSDARRLQKRIQELKTEQDRMAEALEQKMGPLPPAIRPEKPIPLEQQMKSQEGRHESVLEKDVERRLPP